MLDDETSLLWIVFPIAFFDDKLTLGIVIHTDVMYPASSCTRRSLDSTVRDPPVKKIWNYLDGFPSVFSTRS
jgi:hypothetical protein